MRALIGRGGSHRGLRGARVTLMLAIAAGLLVPAAASASGRWSAPAQVADNLSAVSCATPTFCAAVGGNNNAVTYNGTSWSTPVRVDPAPAFSSDALLRSVSCPTPTFCVAGSAGGSASIYNGSSWTVSGRPGHPEADSLQSVSCPAPSFCAAVGWGTGNQFGPGGFHAAAYAFRNGSWGVNELASNGAQWESVSCPTDTFCQAFAEHQAFVVTYDGASWGGFTAVDPAVDDRYSSSGGPSVSCPTVGFCAMVDIAGNVATYNGTTWSAPANIDGSHWLHSVSCPTPSFCVAVDSAGNALTFNGTSWSAAVNIDGSEPIRSVSCATSAFCVAVGYDGKVLVYKQLAAPRNRTLPRISGRARSGRKLKGTRGSWSGSTPIAYRFQWKSCDGKLRKGRARNCKTVRGARKSSLVLTSKNVGHRMQVVVTATNAAGKSSATSKPTGVVKK